jgi:hypothetical protein
MEIEKEINELNQKEQDMTISMRTTKDLRQKRKIEADRNIIRLKIQELETKLNETNEEKAKEELNKLLIENRYLIFLSVNGSKIEIPTDLKPEIKYQPCGHKQKIHIAELLRNPQFPSNVNLLTHWQQVLNNDITTTMMLNCEECRKQKQSKLTQWGLREDKPNGRANIILRKLQ